jgi:phage-related tail protein
MSKQISKTNKATVDRLRSEMKSVDAQIGTAMRIVDNLQVAYDSAKQQLASLKSQWVDLYAQVKKLQP